jgi:hypothetical protein
MVHRYSYEYAYTTKVSRYISEVYDHEVSVPTYSEDGEQGKAITNNLFRTLRASPYRKNDKSKEDTTICTREIEPALRDHLTNLYQIDCDTFDFGAYDIVSSVRVSKNLVHFRNRQKGQQGTKAFVFKRANASEDLDLTDYMLMAYSYKYNEGRRFITPYFKTFFQEQTEVNRNLFYWILDNGRYGDELPFTSRIRLATRFALAIVKKYAKETKNVYSKEGGMEVPTARAIKAKKLIKDMIA